MTVSDVAAGKNNESRLLNRGLAIAAIAALVISLIPMLYVARFDFATGDDYAYGAGAHLAFKSTHSVLEAIKAACEHVVTIYWVHQGTWFSVFLFNLQPEAFSDSAYAIVPWIMVFFFSACAFTFGLTVLKDRLGFELSDALFIVSVALIGMIQFVPIKPNAFFWYNGAVHYTVPFGLMLIAMTLFIKCLRSLKPSRLIGMTVVIVLLSGMSYLAVVAVIVGPAFIYAYVTLTRIRKMRRTDAWLALSLLAELPGLVISALSPGNVHRGGEEFGFSVSRAVFTILDCFRYSFRFAVGQMKDYPYLWLLFAAILLCALYAGTRLEVRVRWPGLIVVMVICWNASFYAPELYAGVSVSGGVDDTYLWAFVTSACILMITLAAWLTGRFPERAGKLAGSKIVRICAWGLICVLALACRHGLAETTGKVCYDFVAKGYAEDFREQMLLQQELLNGDEDEVVIPCTNGYDGPIMNMPVTEDPDAWTNDVVTRFYGKTRVIGMDADRWHELNGR